MSTKLYAVAGVRHGLFFRVVFTDSETEAVRIYNDMIAERRFSSVEITKTETYPPRRVARWDEKGGK